MFHTLTRIAKWISIPILLISSVFSRFSRGYELTVDLAICLGAIVLVQRAVWTKNYYWAAAFASVAIVFSPIALISKIFLLMGLSCAATCLLVSAVFRQRRLPSDYTAGESGTPDDPTPDPGIISVWSR